MPPKRYEQTWYFAQFHRANDSNVFTYTYVPTFVGKLWNIERWSVDDGHFCQISKTNIHYINSSKMNHPYFNGCKVEPARSFFPITFTWSTHSSVLLPTTVTHFPITVCSLNSSVAPIWSLIFASAIQLIKITVTSFWCNINFDGSLHWLISWVWD